MINGNILVTGASTGIGRACAIRFAEQGYRVLAGMRKPADGEALKAASSGEIEPVLLDVTRPELIDGALAAVGEEPLAGLVNNAGIALTGPLELLSVDSRHKQFEVNVIGLVAVTQACLPLLRRGRGRIVNVGSIAGRSALPGSRAYDASKFAVEAITDALRLELHPWGISVSIIEAGAIATPIWDKTLREADKLRCRVAPEQYALYRGLMATLHEEATKSARRGIPVDADVKAVEHAMTARKPRTRHLVGWDDRLWLLLNLLPDRWRDRLILSKIPDRLLPAEQLHRYLRTVNAS
jgi:NAD(P)-dependent dehydrogenase (short-subunit alcohol dehydrogenase family)